MNLCGKAAVYVGGFGGIGMVTCRTMLKKGLQRLTILEMKENAEKLKELKAVNCDACVNFLPLNLRDKREKIKSVLDKVVADTGTFDVLVNGSGIINDRDLNTTMDINLNGLIYTTLDAIPLMSKDGCGNGGVIVNIASVLGLTPCPFLAIYTASKHGVVGFTRSLVDPHYFKRTGISYMTFCPGFTSTTLLDQIHGFDTFDYSKEVTDQYLKVKKQTPEQCGQNLVKAIEKTKNGDVYICDLGELRKVDMPKLWEYPF